MDMEIKKKNAENENKKMFRSRFDIFVLNALNDKNGEGYGYDVINYIQTKTKGHYKIKTFSTIYNTLKRLEEQNYVVSHKGGNESNGATRVYYTLTDEGRAYLEEDKLEYKYLRTLLDNLLTDEDFDLDKEQVPFQAADLKPLTKRVRTGADDVENENFDEQLSAGDGSSVENQIAAVSAENIISETKKNAAKEKPVAFEPQSEAIRSVIGGNTVKSDNTFDYREIIERITRPVFEEMKQTKKSKPAPQTASPAAKTHPSYVPPVSGKGETSARRQNTGINGNAASSAVVSDRAAQTNIGKLRADLRSDGYSLNTFKQSAVSPIRYVFINKLLRDSITLSALYCILVTLILYLCRAYFDFSLAAACGCVVVSLAAALTVLAVWLKNPNKRKKDVINLKAINAVTISLFTVFFLIDLVAALLIPNGKSLNSPQIYAPVMIASTSLFFGMIFSVLHKSENYIQK